MKKTNNSILLRSWLVKTLVDNPDIISKDKSPEDVYSNLQTIWLAEVQDSFKVIIREYSKLK